MADPRTDYVEDLVCRWATKGEVVPAGTRHVPLFSALPTDAGGGTEIAGGSIGRVAMAAGTWADPTDVDGGKQFATSADALWAAVTVAQADALGWGIIDAAAAGNLLWYAALNEAFSLPVGKRPFFPAGSLAGIVGSATDLLSDYSENLEARWLSKGEEMPAGARHMTLFSADPTDAGTGAEIAGDAIVRILTAAADWGDPADYNGGKRASNVNPLSFVAPTLDKPDATHWGLMDAAVAGNLIVYGELEDPVSLPTGRALKFPAGFFRVTVGA